MHMGWNVLLSVSLQYALHQWQLPHAIGFSMLTGMHTEKLIIINQLRFEDVARGTWKVQTRTAEIQNVEKVYILMADDGFNQKKTPGFQTHGMQRIALTSAAWNDKFERTHASTYNWIELNCRDSDTMQLYLQYSARIALQSLRPSQTKNCKLNSFVSFLSARLFDFMRLLSMRLLRIECAMICFAQANSKTTLVWWGFERWVLNFACAKPIFPFL